MNAGVHLSLVNATLALSNCIPVKWYQNTSSRRD